MNIIVISLKRAAERREKIVEQLNSLFIHDAIIMDAVDGKELSEEQLNKTICLSGGWRYGEKFMPGEIGCTMSHINALKMARMREWPYVIVLEDDITIAQDFEKRIKLLFKLVSSDWEHIYLSGKPNVIPAATTLLFPTVIKSNSMQQTHSMIINKIAYDKIIDKLSKFETTTDDIYCDMLAKNTLVSYTYYPFVTHANSDYSYIWDKTAGHNVKNESKYYFKDKIFE
jgi:glycosyl transferase family 25